MRQNVHAFGAGIVALTNGDETDDAYAAASQIADVLNLVYQYLTRD